MTLARDAAILADALTRQLLVASSTTATPAQRRSAMRKAFEVWPGICRKMVELEALAPDEAEAGYAFAERLRDHLERSAA